MRLDLDKKEIKRLYIKENKTIKQIATIFNCHFQTISSRLKGMGIKMRRDFRNYKYKEYFCIDCKEKIRDGRSKRCRKCDNKYHTGRNARRFVNGSARSYYQRIAKENLRQECFKCKIKEKLCVHHIDENQKNNDISNLMMLCKSCHSKIHKRHKNFGSFTKLRDIRNKINKLIKFYEGQKGINMQINPDVILNDLKNLQL